MGSVAPAEFDAPFLDWFRQRTESAWAAVPDPTLQSWGALGCKWLPGTRWLDGLDEGQLAKIERRWSLRFPPDYRLFLRQLHAVDRPMRCTAWREETIGEPQMDFRDRPAFYSWLSDGDAIQIRLDDLISGLVFDVEQNDLWRPGWGSRPATAEARRERIRQLIAAAPRLVPVFEHRYLLAEPCQAGNPVFSIVQSDIIVYGADLRGYFLVEFAELLGLDRDQVMRESRAMVQDRFRAHVAIPFWGDLYAN